MIMRQNRRNRDENDLVGDKVVKGKAEKEEKDGKSSIKTLVKIRK